MYVNEKLILSCAADIQRFALRGRKLQFLDHLDEKFVFNF